jgi:hypothetical protein
MEHRLVGRLLGGAVSTLGFVWGGTRFWWVVGLGTLLGPEGVGSWVVFRDGLVCCFFCRGHPFIIRCLPFGVG